MQVHGGVSAETRRGGVSLSLPLPYPPSLSRAGEIHGTLLLTMRPEGGGGSGGVGEGPDGGGGYA